MFDSSLDGPPTWMFAAFVVVGAMVGAGFVFTMVLAVRNARAMKRSGLDPFTAQADLVARLARSELLAPADSMESRLAELDILRGKGTITEEEYLAARAKALGI